MSVFTFIAGLLIVAAVISLVMSLMGVLITGALKLLPGVLVVLAIIFFAQGGRVDLKFPEKWKKK